MRGQASSICAQGPIFSGPGGEGDTLRLGRRPKKTVKKLMIEEKVPALRRELFPLLEGEGRAAALAGFGRTGTSWPGRARRLCISYLRR